MRTLAVIPARGGSKGLPGKNARPFLGVSLLERAIRIGQETCDDVVVTTDSQELMELAYRTCGIGSRQTRFRPAELATDEAPMLPVVQDAIRGREGDVIVLLQPTQPLRTLDDVSRAIQMAYSATCVFSVRRVPTAYLPDRVLVACHAGMLPATPEGEECDRRQKARPAYYRDGAVYAVQRATIEGGSLYGSRPYPFVLEGGGPSIDTLEDFERLEALARRSHGEEKAKASPTPGILSGAQCLVDHRGGTCPGYP